MSRPAYNLARFDFVSLRLAVACAQYGSLTAAARDCHLVLAAASRRIQTLEAAVGTPLFERHSRGLVTTAAGQVLVRHALTLLQEMDGLVQALGDLQQGIERHVKLCASTGAINQFLPPLLAEYARRRPAVRIDVEEQVSAAVIASLHEGRADLGAFVRVADTEGLLLREFRTDELMLVLPPRHRLAGRTPIDFIDTLDEHWVSLNDGAAMLAQQQRAALAAGRHLKLRMQVRSFDAVGHLVASGLGIALLPGAAGRPIVRAMGLTMRPLTDPWARRQLMIGVRPDADDTVLALRDFLCEPSRKAKARSPKRQ